jgi:pimeloyl-ACP methyl ester carboxylesterase
MPARSSVHRHTVQVRDIPLEVFEAGGGPPVLFLHGLTGAAASLDTIEVLSEGYHVFAPSHPGYGESARPAAVDAIDDVAYIYLDLIEQIAAEHGPVAVVGCSIGAWIAAEVAIRSQVWISSLVLSTPLGVKVGGPLELDVLDMYAVTPKVVREAMYADPDFGIVDFSSMSDEQLQVHFRNLEATALYGWKPYLHNPKLLGHLPRITTRTLIVQGDSDGFISPALPAAYRDAIAGSTLETILHAGHEPEREQPQAFGSLVADFVSRVSVLQNS